MGQKSGPVKGFSASATKPKSGIVNLADPERLFPAPLGLSGATQSAIKGVPRPEPPRHRHHEHTTAA
jgi:hypothetical protein